VKWGVKKGEGVGPRGGAPPDKNFFGSPPPPRDFIYVKWAVKNNNF